MSGGSLNYVYGQLNDAIGEIKTYANDRYCPLHGDHPDKERWVKYQRYTNKLKEVSESLHDIEWVISGDYTDGDEFEAIDKVLGA